MPSEAAPLSQDQLNHLESLRAEYAELLNTIDETYALQAELSDQLGVFSARHADLKRQIQAIVIPSRGTTDVG